MVLLSTHNIYFGLEICIFLLNRHSYLEACKTVYSYDLELKFEFVHEILVPIMMYRLMAGEG